ncbi:MAG: amidohydrolase family protein [Kurthia sp.]|nr:amidohydrolase family protein [Candidatus Kurthia equi]
MIIDISNTLPQIYFDDVEQLDMNDEKILASQLPRLATLVGWTKKQLDAELLVTSMQSLKENFLQILRSTYSFDNFRILLSERNIKYHAIHVNDSFNDMSEEAKKHAQISRIMKTHTDEFIGFAAFNPHHGSKSMRIVRNAITMQGFKGVTINPTNHGIPADHRKYYPVYSLCEEYQIPIWVQSSLNYLENTSGFIAHPKRLEKPLLDFPDLQIILGHGGWPWLDDMVTMLLKYKNLFVDTTTFTSNDALKDSSGWKLFLAYANDTLQEQIVFGSEWLKLGQPIQNSIDEIENWPLDEQVKEMIFWRNAAKLFKLEIEEGR